jgi:hypothetical protein
VKLSSLICVITFGLSVTAYAQDSWQETTPNGLTDWHNGYVEATGQGTSRYMGNRIQEELMAKQAAHTTAQARLLEIVKGIRLSGLTTLGTHGSGDTRAATRIKGTLRGARPVHEKITWHTDKSSRRGETVLAEVTLRLCITPDCQDTAQNLTAASLNLTQQEQTGSEKNTKTDTGKTDTSAIIIDLEQALYLPALSPEIIDENKKTIYSQDSVDADIATEKGLIHYTKTVQDAQKHPISGPHPVIIKAKRVSKDNRIVLSNTDSKKIASLAALKEGRLIVALD